MHTFFFNQLEKPAFVLEIQGDVFTVVQLNQSAKNSFPAIKDTSPEKFIETFVADGKKKELITLLKNTLKNKDVSTTNKAGGEVKLYRLDNDHVAIVLGKKESRDQKFQELQEKEDKFRSIMEQSNEGIVIVNTRGEIIEWNKEQENITGLEKKKVLGKQVWDVNFSLIPKEQKEKFSRENLKKATLGYFKNNHDIQPAINTYEIVSAKAEVKTIQSSLFVIQTAEEVLLGSSSRDITKLVEAENLIKLNEYRLKKAQEVAQLGNWELNLNNNQMWFSDAAISIFNLPPNKDDLQIKDVIDRIHEDDRNRVNGALRNLIDYNNKFSEEIRINGNNQRDDRIILTHAEIIKGENGRSDRVIGTVQDISKRKNAEKAIFESEKRFRTIFNNSADAIFIHDFDGTIIQVNDIACKRLGYSRKELFKMTMNDLELEEKHFFSKPTLEKLVEKGKIMDETIHYTKNARAIPTEINSRVIEYKNKKAVLSSARNISKRKKAEELLKRSQARLNSLLNNASDIICIINDLGRITYINPVVERILGYTVYELTNTDPSFMVHEDDIAMARKAFKRVRVKPEQEELLEVRVKTVDNKWVTLETSVLNRFFNKYINGFIISARNIDERKQFERALRIAKEKAEESNTLKSTFLANMSHEIRTPMNAIIGFVDLIYKNDIPAKKKQEFYKIVRKNCNFLMNTIDDIFDISRIQTNELYLAKIDTKPSELLYDLEIAFKKELVNYNKADIDLVIQIPDKLKDIIIKTDTLRLKQVLSNLLRNAVKFTKEGAIEAGYTLDKNKQVVFHVKDTGIGIDKKHAEHIFDMFRQADDSATREYGGIGIGLTISKSLIELMGGNMWMESSPGKGSAFYFSLPAKEIVQGNIVDNMSERYALEWDKYKILVVEDDLDNQGLVKEILVPTGIVVKEALNGQQAIEKCRKEKFDIVLMDIRMPLLNGIDAAKEILSFNKDLPIIAITAYSRERDKKECLEAGCLEYLPKPINYKKLLSTINKYLV